MAKAFAVWKAVKFGTELGIQNIVIKGNTLKIVYALRKKSQSLSWYGNLIDDTKIMLHSFQSWYVKHVKREAKMTAHNHLVKVTH